jgi:hypothetical protein
VRTRRISGGAVNGTVKVGGDSCPSLTVIGPSHCLIVMALEGGDKSALRASTPLKAVTVGSNAVPTGQLS